LIDFSKAFDNIDYHLLINKLSLLGLPNAVLMWMSSSLSYRSQVTRSGQILSTIARINRSIVQGSGIGPTLSIAFKSDLKTASTVNSLFKFADDCTLLVLEHTDVQLKDEFDAFKKWAAVNKMVLKLKKSCCVDRHQDDAVFHCLLTDGIELYEKQSFL
jgi:hypothetical protein